MMIATSIQWKQVPLRQILTYLDERVELEDDVEYTTITVKRNNGGLEARERLFGREIQTKKQFRLIPGAFIISRVQCWHQAYAIVPEHLPASMIASSNYDQFQISPEVDTRYFWWYSHSPQFRDTVRNSAFGVVIEKMVFNRETWLQHTIPLPPLDEQRRIVARIEELAARIEQARRLRHKAMEDIKQLWAAAVKLELDNLDAPHMPLHALVFVYGGGTPSKANPAFWQGDIPWVSPKDMKARTIHDSADHISQTALERSAAKLIEPGAVLIVTRGMILAHTVPAAILKVPAAINQDMKALLPNDKVTSEYLCTTLWAYNEELLSLVERSSHDTRKLETPKLLEFSLPVPPTSKQHGIVAHFDDMYAKVDTLARLQSEVTAELDALLPSVLDKAFRGEL